MFASIPVQPVILKHDLDARAYRLRHIAVIKFVLVELVSQKAGEERAAHDAAEVNGADDASLVLLF